MADYKPDVAAQIMHEYEEMEERRDPWIPHWIEKARYVSPDREFMRQFEHTSEVSGRNGVPLAQGVYSETPIEANETWTNGFQGYMTSKHYTWFRMEFEDKGLERINGARKYLQQIQSAMYHEVGRSNFYGEIGKAYYDGGWCGTATISSEWDPAKEVLVYHTWHPYQILVEVDEHQVINRHIRIFMESAVNLVEKLFVDEKDRLSTDVLRAYDETPFKKFPILHSISERLDRNESRVGNDNMPWQSIYMEVGKTGILRESGFRSNPYHTWRPVVRSQEAYGRAPADLVWPAIRKLNRLEHDLDMASQKMVDPAHAVPAEWKGKFSTHPGYNLYYGRDPRRRAYNLTEPVRYDIGVEALQRAEDAVRRGFHNDTFALLAQINITDLKNVTATGFTDLRNDRAILLGPVVGNVEDTLLDPIMDRTFAILSEEGRMPQPPEELVRAAAGAPISVVYQGPLAQLQREHFEQRAIRATLRDIMPILQIHPSGVDVLKLDETIRKAARGNNLDEDLIREEIEFRQIRQQREAKMAEDRQLKVAGEAAGAYKDAAAPRGEDSLAAQVLGAGAA